MQIRDLREKLRDLKVDLGEKGRELLEKIKEKAKDYWKKILEKFDFEKRSLSYVHCLLVSQKLFQFSRVKPW